MPRTMVKKTKKIRIKTTTSGLPTKTATITKWLIVFSLLKKYNTTIGFVGRRGIV